MRFLVLWGALLPFVLRVVAGACVGRWTGQPRMPPQERQHEGLGGLGDCFTRSGVDGTPPCGGAGEEGLVFVFLWRLLRCRRGILSHAQERWHEGWLGFVFWLGGFFHTLGSSGTRGGVFGGFNPLRGATTGVVIRRRATSGETARGVGGGVIRRAGRAPLNGPRKQLHFRVGPEFLR